MENRGWSFNIDRHMKGFKDTCIQRREKYLQMYTWYGYLKTGKGQINATFSGSGTATMIYGNCNKEPLEVSVHLNDKLIDVTTSTTEIAFDFSPSDVLSISEVDGIIKLVSLKLDCTGE